MKRRTLLALFLCTAVLLGAILAVPSVRAAEEQPDIALSDAAAALNSPDVKLGTITGAAYDQAYAAVFPQAEVLYFNSLADLVYALSQGQIDGFLMDDPIARYLKATTEGLTFLEDPLPPNFEYAFAFGGSDFDLQLQQEMNEFLAAVRADGTMDEMFSLWFDHISDAHTVSIPQEGVNGTVRVAMDVLNPPLIYLENEEFAGLEVDLLARFCTAYGYGMEIDVMDFGAVLPAVISGRSDIGSAFLARTPERLETIRFSDPYSVSGNLMIVRAEAEKEPFLVRLASSFEKTFIRENRWKLILQGIGTTLYISVCAALLGSLLGFGICMLRRGKNPVVNGVIAACIRILQGTPLVVLLMILFYVVFAGSGLSGESVAIIGFALNFAAYASEIMRSGIEAVPGGQTEAALAIGYTRPQAFFRIVLPQAAIRFLPVYKGEFISLVKMTSIVGYIAVQDLTKMSDIIRSRTYEAFFPLIVTALIYFLLSALLTGGLQALEGRIRPKRGGRMLKGVKLS